MCGFSSLLTQKDGSPLPHGFVGLWINYFLCSRRVLCLFPPLLDCIMVLLFPLLNHGCNVINSSVGCVFVHHAQLGVILSPFSAYAISPVVALKDRVLWVHSLLWDAIFPRFTWFCFPFLWWYHLKNCWEFLCSSQLCFPPIKVWIVVWLFACSGFVLELH